MKMEFVNCGRKNKCAQVKMQQMAFVLIAITLFFVLVGIFLLSTSLTNIKRGFISQQEKNANEIADVLSKTAEFGCGRDKIQCIDLDKAMIMKNRFVYQNFWEVDSIILRKIYPVLKKDVECSKGMDYDKCNIVNVFSHEGKESTVPGTAFVTLCHKEFLNDQSYEKCDLGLIRVGFKENEALR